VTEPLGRRITESQNHRMVGVGRDLCGSSTPTLLPKQGHPEQAAQDLVQAGLEYLQRSQTGLGLTQRRTGRKKQRMDADPLAKPAESHRARLSWPCTPRGQGHPLKNGQFWINAAEILVWGTKGDSQLRAGW